MRYKKSLTRSSKRGSALVLSMMFVVIVAGMGVCMVQLHSSQNKRNEQAIDNKRAIYIAEAGLAEGFLALCKGQSGQVGSQTVPASHNDGLFWVDATAVDDDRVALVSTGLVGSGRFSLAAVLQRSSDPIASLGFFAGTDLNIGAGAIVDGYNSARGTFAEHVERGSVSTGRAGLIGAGADITLAGSTGREEGTMVYGDAYPGSGGVVTVGVGATVTGETTPRASNVALPEIDVPEVTVRETGVVGGLLGGLGLTDDESCSGRYGLECLDVPDGETHKITGPAEIVVEHLILGDGSTLEIDSTDGAVSIYVTTQINASPTSGFDNLLADPNGFALLIDATDWEDFDGDEIADNPVTFEPQGEFHGYVYAPEANLTISSTLHFLGGLAANSVTIDPGAHLTFDHSLKTSDIAVAGLPKIVAWHTCEVPDAPITARDTTPVKYLEDNAITPVPSPDASSEAYMKVRYYDLAGDTQSYTGLVALFDWTNVKEVTAIMWDDDAAVGGEGQVEVKPSALSSVLKVVRPILGKDGE